VDAIAKTTGGATYHQTNDLGSDVRRVMEDAQVSYGLGFYVEEKALDGKPHDLNVKLAKKPELNGASLRYRKHYLALNPKSAAFQQDLAAMKELVDDPFDSTAVSLMAGAAPDPSKPGVTKVQVRVDLKGLQFERRDGKWAASFDLGMAMENPSGPAPGVSNKPMSLSLNDDQLKQALSAGLIVDNTVPTPAKAVQLRIVVQDKASGPAGSLRLPLNP
jgi:hypothetical protein